MNSGFIIGFLLLLLHAIVAGSSLSRQPHQLGVRGRVLYPTGSRIPDCTNACGGCRPCKRVMVSFKCSAAESCPVVYRCMCHGKYYHVPSSHA